MPRWKALPEELDPQVTEFTNQLRRLVDRSGLSIAAVADRTGYSKTSWERYLNGRLLAPKGAVVALAEVTGTNAGHLTTMWELAERAWSRSEMRHDMTMEAIRISQARAALGEFGQTQTPVKNSKPGKRAASGPGQGARSGHASGPGRSPAPGPSAPAAGPGHAGGVGPAAGTGRGAGAGTGAGPGMGAAPVGPPSAAPPQGFGAAQPPQPPHGDSGSPDQQRRRRKVTMFLAGVVGSLLLIAAVVLLTDLGGKDKQPTADDKPSATPTTSAPKLPAGVECAGDDCTGKDPENMGCGGDFARTTATATIGTAVVEVRYSKTCGAAWARITQATAGDTIEITSGAKAGTSPGAGQDGTVDADKDAYTPMLAVAEATDAKACATLTTGVKGCTTPE
ncbi:XRE family transcriptional regulator [Streptomyces sp. H27-C3]|uniref:helix-turn-helix domain-containing protein n=1 Tax=Streptomyces sp. H27-C3 TaxID=3046305 RepID=UPI0024B97BAD|nr:XRE family transcriptional regulator [Streptomyces sp. H27-C3]MDJ0464045.1 DUF2690 domain-containing protein [Streptomyces sp. H27-C3]